MVFISYSHEDKDFAHRLADDLGSLGVKVWIDRDGLRIGDSIQEKIEEALQKSAHFVAILSPDAVKSRWVKQELRAAMGRRLDGERLSILPVLLHSCTVPLFLKDIFRADFRADSNYEAELRRFAERILGISLAGYSLNGPPYRKGGGPKDHLRTLHALLPTVERAVKASFQAMPSRKRTLATLGEMSSRAVSALFQALQDWVPGGVLPWDVFVSRRLSIALRAKRRTTVASPSVDDVYRVLKDSLSRGKKPIQIGRHAREDLLDSIRALRMREKKVVVLYLFEELTLNEIAEVLGITESHVSEIYTDTMRALGSVLLEDRQRKSRKPKD
ncbi:MAG: TIR domain-containing protein [Spirochaetia bacterium]|jgi:RNA polymerase sigma factor (sigma-70 family)